MPIDLIHTTSFDSAANLVAMGLMKPPMNFLAVGLMQPLRRTSIRPIALVTDTGRPWLKLKSELAHPKRVKTHPKRVKKA